MPNARNQENEMYRVKMTQALDFVKVTPEGLDYWDQPDISDWSEGCSHGRNSARKLATFMADQEDPTLLGRVVSSISNRQRFGAVETGFFTEIATDIIHHQMRV